MSTLTIRLPDDKHERLRELARSRGISLNKLVEEWSTMALAEHDALNRFRIRAAKGNPVEALALLDKLDQTSEP